MGGTIIVAETVERCSNCGLPIGVGRGNVWHANGVITSKYPPYIRGTLYDVDELNYLFAAISERIGFDISHLAIEGKRKDSKRYMDSLLKNLAKTGPVPPPIELYRMVARFGSFWGLGRGGVVDYKGGQKLTVVVKDVYSVTLFQGDLAGVFDAVERKRGEPRWRGDAANATIEIVAAEGEPELEERIEQEVEMGIPFVEEGDLEYRHCPECGVPLEIARQFEWDVERGRIKERDSGKRCTLHNTNGIVAVVRVLREELGEEINDILTGISREYARDYYDERKGDSSLDAELMRFPLRSWGRPAKLLRREGGYRLRMVNPYCAPIVAGRVWGLIEVFEGRDLVLDELNEGEGYLDIALGQRE
jgi:predicted hydrocarbon binding protein